MAHKIKTYRGVNWKAGLLEEEARVLKVGGDENGRTRLLGVPFTNLLPFYRLSLWPVAFDDENCDNDEWTTAYGHRATRKFPLSRIVDSHGAEGQKVNL